VTAAPYTLRLCDLRTDRNLGRIQVQDVGYDDYIGKTGSLSCTAPVPSAAVAERLRGLLLPGRTMAYVERGTQIVWGGIVWTRTPTRDDRGFITCPIQGAGLESYYRGHRQIKGADRVYTGVDQLAIARDLFTYAASQSGGDLGIEMDTSQLSGVLRDRTYSQYDLQWIGQILDQLAGVDGGFEWRIQCYADTSGTRHRALRLGYPKLTAGTTAQDLVLSSPGPIRAYSLPEDATVQANAWQSRGASTNTNQAAQSVPLMSAALTTPADIAAGWPLLDGSSDYSSVSDQATLDGHAAADLARWVRPVVIPSVSVLTGSIDQPQLGSYVRLRIRDTWFYDGLTARYRVVGLRATPAQRGRPDLTELFLEAA
jgi:hypothetical protein